jgi:hypothetical protein
MQWRTVPLMEFDVHQKCSESVSISGSDERIACPLAAFERYAFLIDELDLREIDVAGGIRQKQDKEITQHGLEFQQRLEPSIMVGGHRP